MEAANNVSRTMNTQSYINLKMALSNCVAEWGLAYDDYIYLIEGAIANGSISHSGLQREIQNALSEGNEFDWAEVLEVSGALTLEHYPDVLASQEKSMKFAMDYLLPFQLD